MSRCDNQEGLNGSSESILVKNDSNLDTSAVQTDSRIFENYDLEVQKPAERAKIINDNAFFKKLSYSFYSESTRNSRSYSALPKHFDTHTASPQEQKKPSTYPTSEPLSKTILNSLHVPFQAESKLNGSVEQHAGTKAFKIKTLQNFYLPAGKPVTKAKPSTPLNKSKHRIDAPRTADKNHSPRKVSLKLESSTPKQDNKANSPVNPTFNLEKLLKGTENKSSLSTTKISPKLQIIEKLTPQKTAEPVLHRAGSSNGFEASSPNNIAHKLASPKTTKLVLLPAGRISEPKKNDKGGAKNLRNNINALVAKDTAARLSQLTSSRAALKKNVEHIRS